MCDEEIITVGFDQDKRDKWSIFFRKKIQDVVITVPSSVTSSPFGSYSKAALLSSSTEILL